MFAFTQVEKQQRDTSGLAALLNSLNNNAKDTSLVLIADVSVHGNKKTKPYIIEREIPFKQGQYIRYNELVKAPCFSTTTSYKYNSFHNSIRLRQS
jgi:outer membrane protein assembly factor BamA